MRGWSEFVPQFWVWIVYFLAVAYLVYRLFKPAEARVAGPPNFRLALALAVPISVLAGFLGIGPGFLLMPTLIIVGFDPKVAAAINAFAVTPPSFSALLPHLASASWTAGLTVPLLIAGAAGSFIGAKVSAKFVPSSRLKQLFGLLIVVMTGYRILQMLGV